MKIVTAIVNPAALEEIKEALRRFGSPRYTISPAHGNESPQTGTYRGATYIVDTAPRVRVEVICDVFDAESIAAVIASAARRSQRGDGVVWISDVDQFTRIRTGDTATAALR